MSATHAISTKIKPADPDETGPDCVALQVPSEENPWITFFGAMRKAPRDEYWDDFMRVMKQRPMNQYPVEQILSATLVS